jgi:hypothetical protein
MKYLVLVLCLFSGSLFAAPDSIDAGNSDGLLGVCAIPTDVGSPAYNLDSSTVSEKNSVLAVKLGVTFLSCASNFNWIKRNPYDAIPFYVNGMREMVTVSEVRAVLFDSDNMDRNEIMADKQSTQDFSFQMDGKALDQKASEMKNGESFTKKFYFLIENRITNAQGASRYISSGSFDINLTWKKTANAVSIEFSR